MGLSEIIRYCIRYTPESTDSSSFFLLIGHKWWYVKNINDNTLRTAKSWGGLEPLAWNLRPGGWTTSAVNIHPHAHTQWTRILWIWFKHVQSCLYSNPQNEMFGQGMTTVSNENYHLDGPLRTIHIHGCFCQKLHSALALSGGLMAVPGMFPRRSDWCTIG